MKRSLHATRTSGPETAVIVAAVLRDRSSGEATDSLEELVQLATTAGARVVGRISQSVSRLNPSTYIGAGKVKEVAAIVAAKKADLVIFDDDLSPVQIRNLENAFGCKLLDRSGLILDIFARRAKTAVAKTQVELAQLEYLRTRLTRQWTHLSRQQGGIGTRGPGETQIETDRRLIGRRMVTLRQRLTKIDRQRTTQRRGRAHLVRVALVGYTNAGKSTLLNGLAGAAVTAEDRLFATLDATTRIATLGAGARVLVSDTVGFIRKLPHNLIESFKSTLDEVRQSDYLLHVVNAHHPRFADQMRVVNETLQTMGVLDKPSMLVFNKIDVLEANALRALKREYAGAAFISALRNIGMDDFGRRLQAFVERDHVERVALVPVSEGKTIALIRRLSKVVDEDIVYAETEDGRTCLSRLRYRVSRTRAKDLAPHVAPFVRPEPEG